MFAKRSLIALMLLAASMGTPARAGTVVTLPPEAVLANADTAFAGTVVSITPRRNTTPDRSIWTDYRVRIDTVLSDGAGLIAAAPGGVMVVPILGGRIGDREERAHGAPEFAVGERAFFFMNKSEQGAMCPILGWWQGVYRVRAVNGRDVVTHADGCCAPAGGAVVKRHFFAKVASAPEGFTPEEFAAEVRRAMPAAKARPELTLATLRKLPENLPPGAFTADHLRACEAGRGWSDGIAAGPSSPAVERRPAPAQPPAHEVFMLPGSPEDSETTFDAPPPPSHTDRFGFFSDEPDFPWRFNVAPNMGVFQGDTFQQMGYWNLFTGNGLFYTYNSPTNTVEHDNERNEVVFATDAVLSSQGGGTWGTALGVCRTLSSGGEINEADIYINLNPGIAWTLDKAAAFGSSANFNNNPILYFPTAMVHELGHSFGLEHQWIPNPGAQFPSVMNYFPGWLWYDVESIHADDANGLRWAYPEFSVFVTDAGIDLWSQIGGTTSGNNDSALTTISPTSVQRGNSLAIGTAGRGFTVTNPGTVTVTPRADFFLCPSHGNFTNAIFCGSHTLPTMNSGASSILTRSIIVPAGVNPGPYYVGVNLVVTGDEWGWNNQSWSYQPVTVTAAAPPNDSSASATILSCAGGSVSSTTFGATSSGFDTCNSWMGPDVWYRLTTCSAGTITINTCASGYDTVIQLLDGGLGNVLCNDDAAGGPCNGTLQSYLSASVAASSTYYIRVAGYHGASGNFNLNVSVTPANDDCAIFNGFSCSRTAFLPINTVITGSTIGATRSAPGSLPACPFQDWVVGNVDIEAAPDVWYALDAPCTGPIYVSCGGSNWIFQADVYSGCPDCIFSAPSSIACGQPTFGSFNPVSSFNAVAGTRYAVRVRGVQTPDNFTLYAAYQSPDDHCDAIWGVRLAATLTEAAPSADVPFSTACAQPSGIGLLPGACFDGASFDPGNDQLVGLLIETGGTLNITRCFGSYLPSVALYTGNCLDGLSLAACGYSTSSSCDPVIISTPVVAGQYFIVRVAGHSSYAPIGGTTTLHLEVVPAPTGACCAADGSCEVATSTTCGNIYQGDDTVCDPTPCPQPTGGCCVGPGDCQVMTALDCTVAGGAYQGDGAPCLSEPGNPITCCPANVNGVGGLSVQDIFDFLALYFTQDPAADINGSGTITVQDIFDFLASYFQGC